MAKYYQEEDTNLYGKKRIRYTAVGEDLGSNPMGWSFRQQDAAEAGYEMSTRPVAIVTATREQEYKEGPAYTVGIPPEDPDGQLQLLKHMPEQWQISALAADTRIQSSVPTLLAMAIEGRNITHDPWLSEHSSRLIKKAKTAGVDIEPHERNPEAEATSTMQKRQWPTDFAEKDGKLYGLSNFHQEAAPLLPVPEETVQRARQTVREVLRPRKLSPQFDAHMEQLQLPGLED